MFFEDFARLPGSRAARKPPLREDPQGPAGPGGGQAPPPPDVEMTPEQERTAQEQYKMGSDILTPYDCPIGDGKVDVLETLLSYIKTLQDHQSELSAHGIDPLPAECSAENLRRWWESGKDINIAAIRQDGWTLLDAHGDYAKAQQDLAENMGGFNQAWDDGHATNAQAQFQLDQQHAAEHLQGLRAKGDTVRQVADHVQQALYAKRDQMGQSLSNLIGAVGNNGHDFEERVKSALAIWSWQCPSMDTVDDDDNPVKFAPSGGSGVNLQDVLGYFHARHQNLVAREFRDKWYVSQNFWGELNGKEASGENALGILASVKSEELPEMAVPQYVRQGEGNKVYADNNFVAEDLKKMRDLIEKSCEFLFNLHENMKQEIGGYYEILRQALNGPDATAGGTGGGSGGAGAAGGAGADGGAGSAGGAEAAPGGAGADGGAGSAGGAEAAPGGAGGGSGGGDIGQALGSVGQALSSAGQSLGQAASGLGSALGGGLQGLMGSIGQIIQAAVQAAEQAQQAQHDDKGEQDKDGEGQDGQDTDNDGQDTDNAGQDTDKKGGAHGGGEPKPAGTSQAGHQPGAPSSPEPGAGGRHAAPPQAGPSLATAPAGMGHAPAPQGDGGDARKQSDNNHGEFEVQANVRQVGAGTGNQGHLTGFE